MADTCGQQKTVAGKCERWRRWLSAQCSCLWQQKKFVLLVIGIASATCWWDKCAWSDWRACPLSKFTEWWPEAWGPTLSTLPDVSYLCTHSTRVSAHCGSILSTLQSNYYGTQILSNVMLSTMVIIPHLLECQPTPHLCHGRIFIGRPCLTCMYVPSHLDSLGGSNLSLQELISRVSSIV